MFNNAWPLRVIVGWDNNAQEKKYFPHSGADEEYWRYGTCNMSFLDAHVEATKRIEEAGIQRHGSPVEEDGVDGSAH